MGIRSAYRIVCLASIAVLAAMSGGATAQEQPALRLSGLINDYSAGQGGPWHLNAQWELMVRGGSGRADFSAAVAMVRSDLWVVLNQTDPADTEGRMPHTHHVTLVDGTVTALANGFRITGTATATGSGNPAFTAPAQIDITGGSAVQYSNIAVTFGTPASNHFGTNPLNGVVVR